jgi:hypothetical protein
MATDRTGAWRETSRAARSLGPWGWGALGAIALACYAVAAGLPGIARAMVSPSADAAAVAPPDASRVDLFRASFKDQLAQFNGRSMFFVPGAPPPPPPPPSDESEQEAPPPSRYGGPAVIAMISGVVWFDNGTRLRSDEAASGGLRVVSINSPWGARIEWSGQEWDVPLFDRTTQQFLEEQPKEKPASNSETSEEKP